MLAPLQQAVRLDPKHARAHSALGAMYLERQQYDLAWQHAQQAAQLGAPVQPLLEALRRKREQSRQRGPVFNVACITVSSSFYKKNRYNGLHFIILGLRVESTPRHI